MRVSGTSAVRMGGLALALIGHDLSAKQAPVSETVTRARAQFDYGRHLVMGCRYTVHDSETGSLPIIAFMI
jgi:hypothetical protein